MLFLHALNQLEAAPELRMHAVRAVPHHVQAAAPSWTLGAEARHDDVAPGAYGTSSLGHVLRPVRGSVRK